jgi:hypothetical protein
MVIAPANKEMKKLKIAFLFLVLPVQLIFAQQDPLSSQYMFNTLTYNPGVAGTSGMICATAMNRQQWIGFKGAPATTLFNISAPVSLFGIKSGVGLLVESDNVGFDKNNIINLLHTKNLGDRGKAFKQELLKYPEISSASYANRLPPNVEWQLLGVVLEAGGQGLAVLL